MGLVILAPTIAMDKLPVVQSLVRALRPSKTKMHRCTYPVRYYVYISDRLVEIRSSDNSDADQAAIRGDWITIGNDMRKVIKDFRIHQGA